MNPNTRVFAPRSAARQRGLSTLLIAILLLAIVTIITIFGARFGIFEQRMSANDYRYKMAFQAAEGGLNQSMEFIRMSTAEMLSTAEGGWLSVTAPQWVPCADALPEGMLVDPCLAEPDAGRRADMYRYVGATDGVLPVGAMMPALDMTGAVGAGDDDHVESFAAEYDSYATLCRLDITIPDAPRCALNPTTGDTFYVTIVSRGALPGENAFATVKQSFGTFRTLGAAPDAPLIAAGAVLAVGNAEIVPNPNAGGFGVPVSIWSDQNVHVSKDDPGGASNANFKTCELGEWLTTATPESLVDGICADCSCKDLEIGYGMLSAGGSDKIEGPDILDFDCDNRANPDPATCHSEATPRILHDGNSFPDDLFAYVFATPKSKAEEFLSVNADDTDCVSLNEDSGGLYWWDSTDDCELDGTIGSLTNPVVLVSNGKIDINKIDQFFGILYVRDTTTGDMIKVSANGPQVYGSVILEGEGSIQGGAIIYNEAVLRNIRNSPNFLRYGPVPGSWSDSLQ